MLHAVTGRLLQEARATRIQDRSKFSHTTTLRDIANAFPSLGHAAMNRTLGETTDSYNRQQLKARHELLEVRITTGEGKELIFHPGTGGAQGDRVMPEVP